MRAPGPGGAACAVRSVCVGFLPARLVRGRDSHYWEVGHAVPPRMGLVNSHGPWVTTREDVEGDSSLGGCAVARCHNARVLCTGGGTRTLVRRLSDAHTSIAPLWHLEIPCLPGYLHVAASTSAPLPRQGA